MTTMVSIVRGTGAHPFQKMQPVTRTEYTVSAVALGDIRRELRP